jgi:tRNA-intron endonuclease
MAKKKDEIRDVVDATFVKDRVVTESSDEARELYNKSRFGSMVENQKVQLTLAEALYLLEKGKLNLYDGRKKIYDYDRFLKRATKLEPNFWVRYCVLRDFRNRGYIIKTALKFGADFRVYDRGVKPGEDHAKWIVFPVREADTLTWYEFSAKNRVAHSTRKRLLIAAVDEEGDVTYWEVAWKRP